MKKIKIFRSCSRFKTIPQLFSTIEIVSVVVTIEQQTIFRSDLLILFNNLNVFAMNSSSFIRVQKKYFFEFGKMIEFFRVRSPGCKLRKTHCIVVVIKLDETFAKSFIIRPIGWVLLIQA